MTLRKFLFAFLCAGLAAGGSQAQTAEPSWGAAPNGDPASWQACQRIGNDPTARLACFDRWAAQQAQAGAATAASAANAGSAGNAGALPPASATAATVTPAALASNQPATPVLERPYSFTSEDGCRDRQYSPLSRFWELEKGSDCGTLGFRGYAPLSVGIGFASQPPDTPTSPAPNHNGTPQPYQSTEMRIGLSVRTKLAENLLTSGDPQKADGFWFAYSQFSTWQVFNEDLSRPFRATDHEPEIMYTYPTTIDLGGGWRVRYTGLGLNHLSNGESEPYSRSWNRVMLMGGIEKGDTYAITARVWKRINESAATDDNPDISDYYGRAEVRGTWNVNRENQLSVQVRNNLRASGKGSILVEWFKAIGDPARSHLRFQTQLFYGYGDTMIDYNSKRTILTVGFALVDF